MALTLTRKELDKMTSLRFATSNAKIGSLEELIHKYFILRFQTFEIEGGGNQCGSGRARSVEDFYLLLKNYIPGINLRQTQSIVKALLDKVVIRSFCHIVHRDVHDPRSMGVTPVNIRKALVNAEIDVTSLNNQLVGNFHHKFKKSKK